METTTRQLLHILCQYSINVKIDELYCHSCYLYSENISVTVFPVRALRDVQLPRLLGDAEQPIADQYC